jgi:hypothetical protein
MPAEKRISAAVFWTPAIKPAARASPKISHLLFILFPFVSDNFLQQVMASDGVKPPRKLYFANLVAFPGRKGLTSGITMMVLSAVPAATEMLA